MANVEWTQHSTFEGAGHEIGVSNHVVKVIEVLAESPHSWEDAARVALREATRSLRNVASIYIKDLQAVVRDGRVAAWRINAKVSFVVSDRDQDRTYPETKREETTMRYRPQHGRSYDDDYGLHGDERREYRGRESYEQQSRGGQGGRSGMFNQRYIPREHDERYRNNAEQDRRGYQDLGSRRDFEGGGRDFDYGQQRGTRGPKGYKRSDERIREDVCDRLSQNWDLDASEIEVSVSGGEVTLSGTVSDREQKFRAEHIADAVRGVNEVHNQIRVRREMTAQPSPQPGQIARGSSSNQSRSS